MLERAGAAAVARRQVRTCEAAGRTRVVQGLGQVLPVEVGHELHHHGRAGRVEREQVGLVRAGTLRDGEDLFTEQTVDVGVDHLVRRRLQARLGSPRAARGRDQQGPLGIDLEQWHLVISPGPATLVRLSLKAGRTVLETRG
nr:hypothetical protein GCM10025730_36520 [Promicromonospora thailandica]